MRKHHDNETFRARSLLERGDGGYRPGDRYPTLSKGSFYDEVFAAAFGRTEKEHDEAMEYQARQFARDSNKYSLTSVFTLAKHPSNILHTCNGYPFYSLLSISSSNLSSI